MKRAKYGFFTKIFSALVILISSLCFVSCGDILNILVPVLFGQISDFTATPGNEYVSLSWNNGYYSGYLQLKVNRTDSTTIEQKGWMEPDAQGFLPTGCYVDGLHNNVSYTFTLSLYEQEDENSNLISQVTARATPTEDGGGGSGGSGGGSGSSTTMNVSGGQYFLELPGNTSSVTITGANGKLITYANVNTNTSGIIKSSAARRYVSGLRAADTGIREVASAAVEDVSTDTSPVRHFVPPSSVTMLPSAARSGASGDTWNKSNPQIGQTRSIYVDADANISSFRQEQMTLYAIGYKPGTDDDIACLVWAKASDVESGHTNSVNTKISEDVIQDIVFKFVQHYQFEEEVFGNTYDRLLTKAGSTPLSNAPTNDWVNIVLYDIGRDGTKGSCGVVGYFWAKDYYNTGYTNSRSDPRSVTNEGKYFYIDVPFCNYNSTSNTYTTGNNSVSGTVLSTLFHEYQHMIDFNTKTVTYQKDTTSCTWYNEMLSMLCEDIMGDQLGLGNADRVATGRIKNFNAYYYYSGIAQYLDTNSWVSYGTAYAFGAWLVRNYGGVPLIKEMSRNNAVGIDSIVKAVKTVTGVDRSWAQLMEEYIQACAFRTTFAGNHGLDTFNVVPNDTYTTSINGAGPNVTLYAMLDNSGLLTSMNVPNTLEGTLKGINLWSGNYRNKTTYGPVILGSSSAVDVQPTGFVFHNVGKATQDEVTLRFTTSSNSNEKLYIFVQDNKASSDKDLTVEVTQS
ncbi:MAG: hypothetical protein J5857_01295 [Treponema sp.]|nr:hypothetical protein [Treponema sp.]